MSDIWAYLSSHDSLPWSLIAIIAIMVFTGRLKPKSDFDEKNREAERWRKAYELEREARAKALSQAADLLEIGKTTHAIVTALFNHAQFSDQSGGEDVVHPQKSTRRRR